MHNFFVLFKAPLTAKQHCTFILHYIVGPVIINGRKCFIIIIVIISIIIIIIIIINCCLLWVCCQGRVRPV